MSVNTFWYGLRCSLSTTYLDRDRLVSDARMHASHHLSSTGGNLMPLSFAAFAVSSMPACPSLWCRRKNGECAMLSVVSTCRSANRSRYLASCAWGRDEGHPRGTLRRPSPSSMSVSTVASVVLSTCALKSLGRLRVRHAAVLLPVLLAVDRRRRRLRSVQHRRGELVVVTRPYTKPKTTLRLEL